MSTDPNTNPSNPPADPAAAFQRLLDQHKNDGIAVASKLFDENFRYRGEIRELKKKVPGEGSVVLTGDDAKAWDAFKAFNQKPEDVKKAIDRVAELENENRELASMENLREIADIGLEGSKLKLSVLKDQLAKFPEAVISFKTEKDADGKEAKVAYVKKTEKDSETKFADFAKADLADYLPSLKVSNEANQQPFTPGNGPDPKPTGGSTSVFDRIREDAKARNEAAKPVPGLDIDSRFNRPAAA
jgi:phage terminase large subunit